MTFLSFEVLSLILLVGLFFFMQLAWGHPILVSFMGDVTVMNSPYGVALGDFNATVTKSEA